MQRKKILYITSGSTPYRKSFFNAFAEIADLTVLYERQASLEREWVIEQDERPGLTEIVMRSWLAFKTCAFCPEVITYLKKNSYDHIIIGGYSTPTAMLAILWLRLHKKKYVLNADGGLLKPESPVMRKMKTFFISGADKWLSTGTATTEYFLYYGARKEDVFVYPFTSVGCSDVLSQPLDRKHKDAIRNDLGMAEERIILCVGQFIHRKGIDVLMQACTGIDSSVGVYVVGGVPTEEYLRMKEELGLTNVHFVGFMQKEQLQQYYLAADLFVLPTREDIWGLVINEALAKALPVVTTDRCVAGLELVINGENGYIVPVEDAAAVSKAINACFRSDEVLDTMAQNALKSITYYTFESMAKVHLDIVSC